ncbi:hemolysin [Photobacterium aquae]|uniref:Hemolysin n=1 Tax=Photobacterium aquae TaxID=1195763 RepID=A0A0J1H351_9GAMM|nr:BON domain-containing protein [Photobacterium aquae]KLV06206.1 hemolysin [Photobacterium aquae]
MRKLFLPLLLAVSLLSGCSMLNPDDPRTAGQQWQDQNIEMEIAGLITKPPFRHQARVNAISISGRVLLIGQAVDAQTSRQLERQVRDLAHVTQVYNQLQIRPLPELGEVSQDSWLTTKVKAQLVASKQLRDVSIIVATEGQHVYLLGFVTPAQANIAADIARNVAGVKQVIKAFEYP